MRGAHLDNPGHSPVLRGPSRHHIRRAPFPWDETCSQAQGFGCGHLWGTILSAIPHPGLKGPREGGHSYRNAAEATALRSDLQELWPHVEKTASAKLPAGKGQGVSTEALSAPPPMTFPLPEPNWHSEAGEPRWWSPQGSASPSTGRNR